VYQSLSISGLLTLELHALNNEGAEGNTMMTAWWTSSTSRAENIR